MTTVMTTAFTLSMRYLLFLVKNYGTVTEVFYFLQEPKFSGRLILTVLPIRYQLGSRPGSFQKIQCPFLFASKFSTNVLVSSLNAINRFCLYFFGILKLTFS
jgi:hypothetical protein